MKITTAQKLRVYEHLKKGQGLTALEALKKYGIMRLASRIHDLKKANIYVRKVMVHDIKNDKRYAKYFLE